MSSFLQKLKSGATAVDNKAAPDNAGVVTRRLEKKIISQPFEELGITFGNDAEVTAVARGTPAAAANIPTGFMVCNVNGEFVENAQQFIDVARKNVNLTIKLQSTAAIAELIDRVLRDEELRASGELSSSSINFDELYRTTPRFNFLSGDHPLFRRYNKRLTQARQAAALIAQRTHEAEVQRQKEIKERIEKALEEERAAQKKREEQEEAERNRKNVSQQPEQFANSEPFIKIIKDESAFGQMNQEMTNPEHVPSIPATPQPELPGQADLVSVPCANNQIEILTAAPADAVAPVSAEELLALVGLPTDLAPPPASFLPDSPVVSPVPQEKEDDQSVEYVTLPAEEYTLCSGEKVISVIKRRTGPAPPPPPGKPPISHEVVKNDVALKQNGNGSRNGESYSDYRGRRSGQRDNRKRSRTPPSRQHHDRDYVSRDDGHRHNRHMSSSHNSHRSSHSSRHRR